MKRVLGFMAFSFSILLVSSPTAHTQGWNWQNPLPLGNTLGDLYAFDENTAITVGGVGTILKTVDGGTNWNPVYQSLVSTALNSICFVDAATGWAVGSHEVICPIQGSFKL